MSILDKIIADKFREVALKKQLISTGQLQKYPLFERETNSLAAALQHKKPGIIAEHKRRSPSKDVINQKLSVEEVVTGYTKAGVSGISVLTDGKYFGGSLDDLLLARAAVKTPLLRKEFIIDEYQLIEAKAYGADAILLIAVALKKRQLEAFSEVAKNLGLDVLLEIHNEEELQNSLTAKADMIGVNNRNLKTFEVNIDTSKKLSEKIPDNFIKVSESGISTVDAIKELQNYGFKGFLVGENFMKTANPGKSAKEFIDNLRS